MHIQFTISKKKLLTILKIDVLLQKSTKKEYNSYSGILINSNHVSPENYLNDPNGNIT